MTAQKQAANFKTSTKTSKPDPKSVFYIYKCAQNFFKQRKPKNKAKRVFWEAPQ